VTEPTVGRGGGTGKEVNIAIMYVTAERRPPMSKRERVCEVSQVDVEVGDGVRGAFHLSSIQTLRCARVLRRRTVKATIHLLRVNRVRRFTLPEHLILSCGL
jgi:hypothetical protein